MSRRNFVEERICDRRLGDNASDGHEIRKYV